jgi:hypothetical protein
MKGEAKTAVYILLAIYVYGRWQEENPLAFAQRKIQSVKTKARTSLSNAKREASNILDNATDLIEKGGAAVYDATHSDQSADLPGATLTREAVLAICKAVSFPDPKLAASIALAESGGSTGAVNRSSREYSIGLFQINVAKHTTLSAADMKDPIKNARAAFKISKGGTDWRPWSVFNNNRYQQFRTGILAP